MGKFGLVTEHDFFGNERSEETIANYYHSHPEEYVSPMEEAIREEYPCEYFRKIVNAIKKKQCK